MKPQTAEALEHANTARRRLWTLRAELRALPARQAGHLLADRLEHDADTLAGGDIDTLLRCIGGVGDHHANRLLTLAGITRIHVRDITPGRRHQLARLLRQLPATPVLEESP